MHQPYYPYGARPMAANLDSASNGTAVFDAEMEQAQQPSFRQRNQRLKPVVSYKHARMRKPNEAPSRPVVKLPRLKLKLVEEMKDENVNPIS